MDSSTTKQGTRLLCNCFIVLAVALGWSTSAIAQSCGGSVGMQNSPNTLQLTEVPLGEVVRVTLNPARNNLSAPLTIDQVRYALTCTNNHDDVPCLEGNDTADSGGAPIDFIGNVTGDCGATDGSTTDNGDGTVTFSFPSLQLDTAGCFIEFDVEVNDKGTDDDPLILTSAARAEGTCDTLEGSANGSAAITLETVPDIELLKEISIDGGTTWHDANDAGSAPIAEFPSGAMYRLTVTNTGTADLTNIVINDGDLGITDHAIADLASGESVVLDSGDIAALSVATRCDSGGTFVNTASVDAESADDGTTVNDSDPATLVCVGIDVTKTGDAEGKVGDEADYTFTLSNLSGQELADCTAVDTLLGTIFDGALPDGDTVLNESRVVQAGDPNPLPNEVTLSCTVVGPVNTVSPDPSASDDHEVALVDASIEVTKDGPDDAKVGDEHTYTIGFTNAGDVAVENCTGNDTLLGDLGAFEEGVTRDFAYTPTATDDDPLENTATITCDVVGFSNQAEDSAGHSAPLHDPSVELSKVCFPDPVTVGDDINWDITVSNTGDTDLDCLVNDEVAGIVDENVLVAAGTDEIVSASRATVEGDVPSISNTADVFCTLDGVDLPNELRDEASDDCVVEPPEEEICRTPGFWGSRAGSDKPRSTNLTQTVINAAGGSLEICGQTIDNTDVGSMQSATEAMCVRIEGFQQRQLARQLTAMALNCVVSGGGADCSGTSVEGLFAEANAACEANTENLNGFISAVDAFNNGEECQGRELDEATDIFDGINPLPGPAGGSTACRSANGNGIKVVPAAE